MVIFSLWLRSACTGNKISNQSHVPAVILLEQFFKKKFFKMQHKHRECVVCGCVCVCMCMCMRAYIWVHACMCVCVLDRK